MSAPAHSHTEAYWQGIERLEQIARNYEPAAPDDLQTKIVEAVGDLFNIWPASHFDGRSAVAALKIN
jgi:hypothetical protein